MSENILVLGGTGFIGSHVCHALLDRGHKVTAFGRGTNLHAQFDWQRAGVTVVTADLADRERLESSLDGTEVIFHKASSYSSKGDDLSELFHSNIRGTQCLIDVLYGYRGKIRHFVFDSSISVYGEGCYRCNKCGIVRPSLRTVSQVEQWSCFEPVCPLCKSFISPTEIAEDEALNGVSSYAISKKAQEEMLIAASEQLGFSLTILRYATVYGTGQKESNPYSRFLKAIVNGEPVKLNEDGLQKRDFVHIQDALRANLLAFDKSWDGQPLIVNVGSGNETTLRDFINVAGDVARAALGIETVRCSTTNTLIPGDIRHCKISVERARHVLGFDSAIDLRSGLTRWIDDWASTLQERPIFRKQ